MNISDFLFNIVTGTLRSVFGELAVAVYYMIVPAALVVILVNYVIYRKSSYYAVTKNLYIQTRTDIGKYGEYLSYKELRSLEKSGAKFLFNVYIPREDESTTEIDVLLITAKGLFVLESKNYSGWIFGDEYKKEWYQTLPKGKGKSSKEAFFNPVMQNRTHIKYLKQIIGAEIPEYSIIVFSNRCTLKNIRMKSDDIKVIKREALFDTVKDIFGKVPETVLKPEDINEIYNKLYEYTQADDGIKQKHIDDINAKYKSNGAVVETIDDSNVMLEKESISEENSTVVCPLCGAKLIIRTAAKGQNQGRKFLGCSNYPKCRYTDYNINDADLSDSDIDKE